MLVSSKLKFALNSGVKVHITVRDKTVKKTEVFKCPLHLLYDGMKYFRPIIQKECDLLEVLEPQPSEKNKAPSSHVVKLKVNCCIDIFRWLLLHLKGEKPKMTNLNAVSLMLSSHFLRMDDLTDTTLIYVRDNMVDVILSGVDMDCIPGELLGRFCMITKEHHVASAVVELFDRGEEKHSGRAFLATVARHLAMLRLSVGDEGRAPGGSKSSVTQGTSRPGTEKNDVENQKKQQDCGAANRFRWCRLCGVLYDYSAIQQMLKAKKYSEPCCSALNNDQELVMGPRGEVYTTHVPAETPVSIKPPSTWNASEIECWAWRIIGTVLVVICTVCRSPCSLLEAIAHPCRDAQFTCEESSITNKEMDVILRCLQLLIKEGEQEDGSIPLFPFCASSVQLSKFEADSIVIHRHNGKNIGKYANSPAGSAVLYTWKEQPSRVREVVLGTAKGIDVDLINFYERAMIPLLSDTLASDIASASMAHPMLSITPNELPLSYVPAAGNTGNSKGASGKSRSAHGSPTFVRSSIRPGTSHREESFSDHSKRVSKYHR